MTCRHHTSSSHAGSTLGLCGVKPTLGAADSLLRGLSVDDSTAYVWLARNRRGCRGQTTGIYTGSRVLPRCPCLVHAAHGSWRLAWPAVRYASTSKINDAVRQTRSLGVSIASAMSRAMLLPTA